MSFTASMHHQHMCYRRWFPREPLGYLSRPNKPIGQSSVIKRMPSKARLRHVILIPSFPPRWRVGEGWSSSGGAEFTALNLSKYLFRRGSEVHVITRSERIVPYRETIQGVFVHRVLFPSHPIFLRFMNYICSFIETVRLRPHLIHGIGMFQYGVIACISSRLLRTPLIIQCMDDDVQFPNPLVIKLFWKMMLGSVQTIIVKERKSANRLVDFGVDLEKVVVLPNGVDASRFRLNRRKCREYVDLRNHEKAILFVGRLEPIKNVESLLIAFARIREQFQDLRLLLVGAGTEMSRLKRIAAQTRIDHCTNFIGEVSPLDVPRYMVAADIFVLPSISEGSPNVILECLAAGLPILASEVGGVPDLVANGKEGFLFKPGNVTQMADLMSLLLRDSQLRRKMSREGRRRANRFPLDGINAKIFQISMSAIRNSSTRQLRK